MYNETQLCVISGHYIPIIRDLKDLTRPMTYYHYFELGVGGEGQDTSRHFEGIFGSIRAILPMGLGAKTGAKTKIWTKGNRA